MECLDIYDYGHKTQSFGHIYIVQLMRHYERLVITGNEVQNSMTDARSHKYLERCLSSYLPNKIGVFGRLINYV